MTPEQIDKELDADMAMRVALEWAKCCAMVLSSDELAHECDLSAIRPFFTLAFAAGAQWTMDKVKEASK